MSGNYKHLLTAGAAGVLLMMTLAATGVGSGQDLLTLERRVSVIEQRFYSLESRMNRLEQQTIINQRAPGASTGAPQSVPDAELTLLRSEVEILSARLKLLECGVVRLDERTLPAAAREARRKTGAQAADSCRQNADAPLQFPPR